LIHTEGEALIKEYIHQPLGQEVTAISGHYVFTEEIRLPFEGKEIFYLKGYAVVDTSCCGLSGCGFVHVMGFIHDWKAGKNLDGLYVSQYEPIVDPDLRKKIRAFIQSEEVFHQVQFD
jgi:hypothetical protein